jgi:hypothetical protein
MEFLAILSWLIILAAILLKAAAVRDFSQERFPNETLTGMHRRLSFMSWSERKKYRKELKQYHKANGTLVYDRVLTAMLICGILGFLIFGYLADAKLPKHKRNSASLVDLTIAD